MVAMLNTRTRYTFGNVVWFIVGLPLLAFGLLFFGMTFAWGSSPKGFTLVFMDLGGWALILAVPAFLLSIRWCGIAKRCLWTLAGACPLFLVIGFGRTGFGMAMVPTIVLVGASGIATHIDSESRLSEGSDAKT